MKLKFENQQIKCQEDKIFFLGIGGQFLNKKAFGYFHVCWGKCVLQIEVALENPMCKQTLECF